MNNHYNAEEYYLYLKFEEERGRTAREIGSCKNIPCQKRSFCNSMPMIVLAIYWILSYHTPTSQDSDQIVIMVGCRVNAERCLNRIVAIELGLPYDFGTCGRELKLNELSAKISRSECKHESLRDHFWVMDSVTINDLASGVSASRLQPELIRSKKQCLRCSTWEVYMCIQHTAASPNQHHL